MRPIKFRAWDKQYKTIRKVSKINWFEGLVHLDEKPNGYYFIRTIEDVELLQFTGLLDKNGKEIFEGDVVKVDGTKEYEDCEPKPKKREYIGYFLIQLIRGHWGYEYHWEHINGYECSTHIMGNTEDDGGNVEVIGNVFENPELLTPKE